MPDIYVPRRADALVRVRPAGRALVFLVLSLLITPSQAVDRNQSPPLIYTQTQRYDARAWVEGRDRFPQGATLQIISSGSSRPLAPQFAASADAQVSFDGTHVLFAGKRTSHDLWQIWEVAITGGVPRQITTEKANCIRPSYLPDDRIVYTRGAAIEEIGMTSGKSTRLTFTPLPVLSDEVLQDGRILFEIASTQRELFTMYPDGTGVEAVRCDHAAGHSDAMQLSSGEFLFTSGTRLARFAPDSAVQASVDQPPLDVAGPIAEVAPGEWIVSLRRPTGRFGLYRWNRASRQSVEIETMAAQSAVQPVVLGPRVPPKRFPSALAPTRTWGNLLCLDARISKSPAPTGEISHVRAFTLDGAQQPVLLGQAPVEADGSFYLQLPADQPLRLELADSTGRTLRAEHDWFWMRPAEQRVCVGCHAGPEHSPENKVPEVLLRSTVPANLLGTNKQK